MSSTISGNVAGASAGEIVYLQANQVVLQPGTTVTDGSGNYSFSNLAADTFILYTSLAPLKKIQVIADGVTAYANVNFSS